MNTPVPAYGRIFVYAKDGDTDVASVTAFVKVPENPDYPEFEGIWFIELVEVEEVEIIPDEMHLLGCVWAVYLNGEFLGTFEGWFHTNWEGFKLGPMFPTSFRGSVIGYRTW